MEARIYVEFSRKVNYDSEYERRNNCLFYNSKEEAEKMFNDIVNRDIKDIVDAYYENYTHKSNHIILKEKDRDVDLMYISVSSNKYDVYRTYDNNGRVRQMKIFTIYPYQRRLYRAVSIDYYDDVNEIIVHDKSKINNDKSSIVYKFDDNNRMISMKQYINDKLVTCVEKIYETDGAEVEKSFTYDIKSNSMKEIKRIIRNDNEENIYQIDANKMYHKSRTLSFKYRDIEVLVTLRAEEIKPLIIEL